MKRLEVSPRVLGAIRDGKAILFLGAGASFGCVSADGKVSALMGRELGNTLSKEFLGGARSDETLGRIADYASTDSSVLEVQNFVKGIYDPVEPTDFHLLIPQFRWKAIVTTNYDRVIEKAYAKVRDRLQDPYVAIRDGDLRGLADAGDSVPILKLHGCVSAASDTSLPMVLGNEQYAKFEKGRSRLVNRFQDIAKDHPVIFCGYEFDDAHIARILFSLEDGNQDRPTYAAFNPRFDGYDQRRWSRHRMDVQAATFEAFLKGIDASIPVNSRRLGQLLAAPNGSLSKWLKVGAALSNNLQAILAGRLQHVHQDMVVESANPSNFYRGDSETWAPIKEGLDFSRSVNYQILSELDQSKKGTRFVLINGHAGSGKSVVLRRLGWELAGDSFSALCLYCDGSLRGVKDVLQEVCESSGERVFILVDNALNDLATLSDCYALAKRLDLPVTFIGGARSNEWNASDSATRIIPDAEYTVGDLSRDEATKLCALLEKHGCLGKLASEGPDARVDRLMEQHERQLLVALHEATFGAPLRDILRDEYRNVTPAEAQVLYLDICSLHRLGVTVRAGLVSRMSGTSFTQFQDKFFSPLEKVVSTYSDWKSKDFAYRTRHVEIAQIVFDIAFPTPADRANQLARIVGSLNTDYVSDNEVATKLLKGRVIADEFGDRSLADRIFDAADQNGIDKPFLLQQRALFELKHPGGSAGRALKIIDEAIALSKNPKSSTSVLHHTKAVVLRDLSREPGMDPALSDRYREAALDEIRDRGLQKSSNYGVATYCEVLLDQISARMDSQGRDHAGRLSDEVTVRKMGELERTLSEGLQRWPDDSFLSGIRAQLFGLLEKHPQVMAVLRAAFQRAPANEFVALRLARQLIDSDEPEQTAEALDILRKAVGLNPNSKTLNYQLARQLMREDESRNADEVSRLLRRSFTEGDTHFDAQFWSARHEFLYGERARARAAYDRFKAGPVPYVDTGERRGLVRDSSGDARDFSGILKTVKGDFAFVECQELSDSLFLHRTQAKDEWNQLRTGDRMRFKVAFSFRGPNCVDAHLERGR